MLCCSLQHSEEYYGNVGKLTLVEILRQIQGKGLALLFLSSGRPQKGSGGIIRKELNIGGGEDCCGLHSWIQLCKLPSSNTSRTQN